MSIVLKGTSEPLLQRFVRRWSPTNGYIEEAEYRGFSDDKFDRLSRYMSGNGFEYEWETFVL